MAHYLQLGHLNKPEMASDVICKICGIKRPHKQTQTRRFVACPEPKLIVILERISRLWLLSYWQWYGLLLLLQVLQTDIEFRSLHNVIWRYYKRTDLQTGSCAEQYAQEPAPGMHDHVVDSTESHIELALKKADLYLCQCLLADQAVLYTNASVHSYQRILSVLPKLNFWHILVMSLVILCLQCVTTGK